MLKKIGGKTKWQRSERALVNIQFDKKELLSILSDSDGFELVVYFDMATGGMRTILGITSDKTNKEIEYEIVGHEAYHAKIKLLQKSEPVFFIEK